MVGPASFCFGVNLAHPDSINSRADNIAGNRAPTYYYSLSRASGESLDHLRIALTKPDFIKDVTRPQELMPFFLPSMVSQIIRNEFQ